MLAALLIHTVEVYRRAAEVGNPDEAKKDRFGQPLSVNPRQHQVGGENLIATYPCRAWMSAGGLKMEERTIDTFERQFTMYTGVDVDIRENDAVRALDADGRVIFGLSKIKDSDLKYNAGSPHHREFTIWEQSGPDQGA